MDVNQKTVTLQLNSPRITDTTTLLVAGLKQPGEYAIQLVVTDAVGNKSAAFEHKFAVNYPVGLRQKLSYYYVSLLLWWSRLGFQTTTSQNRPFE
tara:strand:+ start:541 stop:825 length:285 start_codon:yes stop_codon:yes gene_type:complete